MYHSEDYRPPTQVSEDGRLYKTYGSRIVFTKECIQCQSDFWPNRSDQKYCSASCRVIACRKRNGYTNPPAKHQNPVLPKQPSLGDLATQARKTSEENFSWKNVGESAVGVAAVTGVKYLAHDKPMMEKLDRVLQHLERNPVVQTSAAKSPLHFLGLRKIAGIGIVALFKDPKTSDYLLFDEKGRWLKQSRSQPPRLQ